MSIRTRSAGAHVVFDALALGVARVPLVTATLFLGIWLVSTGVFPPAAIAAQQDTPTLSEHVSATGYLEPARMMRATGWEWEHEIRVWLPPSYKSATRTYPTLWVTDNALEVIRAGLTGSFAGMAPELIVVSVGPPAGTNAAEFQRRRTYDFIPDLSLMGKEFARLPPAAVGGAPGFLDFLVNQVRPQLATQYRMDPEDHAYAGHSGGGQFGLYVLFNRPQSFNKYIISSPALGPWLDMEQAWFKKHGDIAARVFLSAGEAEAQDYFMARAGIVSTVATVAERLTQRKYPSLELDVRIFPGEDHSSVLPIAYTRGIRSLWSQ